MCAVYVSSELGEVQIVLCMYHLNTSEVQIVLCMYHLNLVRFGLCCVCII